MRLVKEILKTLTSWRRKNRLSRDQIIELIRQYLSDANTRQRTERELVRLGEQALDPLIYVLRHPELPSIYRGWISGILSQIGEPALKSTLTLLQDKNEDIRAIAAGILGSMRDQRAVDPLIRGMKDKSPKVRQSAIQGLVAIGDLRTATFIQYFLRDEELQVRLSAIHALGSMKDENAVDTLVAFLNSSNEHERSSAIQALASIGNSKAVEPILTALTDNQSTVR
jgi:HEAT repeat protein